MSAKLSLINNRYRKNTTPDNLATTGYFEDPANDERFVYNVGAIQFIAASNDSGTFELNFRDERYMPFEGAGAISTWNLELPNKLRQFDYDTISDVIMHISYTAKDDGAFREKVEAEIENILIDYAQEKGLMRLFSMKREFSNNLHKFLHPPVADGEYESTLNITKKHFPYFLHDKSIVVQEQEIDVFLKLKDELQLQPVEFSIIGNVDDGEWILSSGNVELIPENIEDIFILFKYTMSAG